MAKAALFEKSKKDKMEPKGMKEGSKKEEVYDKKQMKTATKAKPAPRGKTLMAAKDSKGDD
jgi:hypothetical protein